MHPPWGRGTVPALPLVCCRTAETGTTERCLARRWPRGRREKRLESCETHGPGSTPSHLTLARWSVQGCSLVGQVEVPAWHAGLLGCLGASWSSTVTGANDRDRPLSATVGLDFVEMHARQPCEVPRCGWARGGKFARGAPQVAADGCIGAHVQASAAWEKGRREDAIPELHKTWQPASSSSSCRRRSRRLSEANMRPAVSYGGCPR